MKFNITVILFYIFIPSAIYGYFVDENEYDVVMNRIREKRSAADGRSSRSKSSKHYKSEYGPLKEKAEAILKQNIVFDDFYCTQDNDTLAKDVLESLMANYDRRSVPNNAGVDVKVDLIIQGMSSINENSASFTADVLFSQIWIDPGMAFDNITRYFYYKSC
uniref:Neurotransmitter-gated ion-channel ligand-binding domain-containing protein n=1 Tax=Panagrolaimus davidi TaxID=227884 RepID=A0A914Q800_9BILA